MLNFLSTLEDDIGIYIHRNPDPDAIGSALGLQWLLSKLEKPSTIYYGGEINHPMNRALVNILGIHMKPYQESTTGICVDCTPATLEGDFNIVAVIDHHRNSVDFSHLPFVDIRQIGSSASMVYSYITASSYSLNREEDQKVILSLLLGIKTDTRDLLSDTVDNLDYEAHQALTNLADSKMLASILDYPLPRYFYDLKSRAYSKDNHTHSGGLFTTYLGIVNASQSDALAIIADEMVRMDGVSTAVIGAIIEDHVVVSLRTSNVSLDASKLVKRVFGEEYAGGRVGVAAAKMPLGFLAMNDIENEEMKGQLDAVIKHVLTTKLKKEISNE